MPNRPIPPTGEIVLYQTDDGRTRVECRFADETLWMSQALMAELFQTTPQNITLHLKALYSEGEILETTTCKEYLQVRQVSIHAAMLIPCHHFLPAANRTTEPAPNVFSRFSQKSVHKQFHSVSLSKQST